MELSDITSKMKKNCEYFHYSNLFDDSNDKILYVPDIHDQNNIRLFFQQVENYPLIYYAVTKYQIIDIIKLSDFYIWKYKEHYIKRINNKTDNLINFINAFDYLDISLDKLISFDVNMYIFESLDLLLANKINKIYLDKYNCPMYYNFESELRTKCIKTIETLTCSKINFNSKIKFGISGGLLVGILTNNIHYSSDCDIFLLDNTDDFLISDIITFNSEIYVATYNKITYIYNTDKMAKINKIQLIDFGYITPLAVLNSFDLDICKIMITKNKLYINSIGNKQLFGNYIDCEELYLISKTVNRLVKYKHRGFVLNNLDIDISKYEHKENIYDNIESYKNSLSYINQDTWKKNVDHIKYDKNIYIKQINSIYNPYIVHIPLKYMFNNVIYETKNIWTDVIFIKCNNIMFMASDIKHSLNNLSQYCVISNKYVTICKNGLQCITLNGKKNNINNLQITTYINVCVMVTFSVIHNITEIIKMDITKLNILNIS